MPQYIDLSLSSVPEKCRVEMEFCQLKNQMKYQLPPYVYEKVFQKSNEISITSIFVWKRFFIANFILYLCTKGFFIVFYSIN